MFFVGCIGFALCLLGDVNDAFWRRRWLRPSFALGAALTAFAAAWLSFTREARLAPAWRIAFAALGAVSLALTVAAVFFAVPPSGRAASEGERRAVTTGLYALCRHPGVLFSAPLLLSLWGACGLPAYAALAYFALNALYAFIQDRWLFPHFLIGYDDYRTTTPFLLPTPNSVRRTLGGKESK